MDRNVPTFKKFEDLRLSDNFMFAAVMQDTENCKALLELVLGVKIVKISRPETEKSMKFTPDSKGIRLDVYVENEDAAYDIEMQTTFENLPKRSRYYQGVMDRGTLKKGEHYSSLRKGIVIFICTFDGFGKNLPVYTFENLCIEDKSIRLNDDTMKIFLNTKGDTSNLSEGLKNFYTLINDGVAKDDFTNKLNSDINIIKNDDIWRERFMDWNMTFMDVEYWAEKRGREEGVAIGKNRGMVEAFLKAGYTPEKIAEETDIPLDKVKEIIEELEVKA